MRMFGTAPSPQQIATRFIGDLLAVETAGPQRARPGQPAPRAGRGDRGDRLQVLKIARGWTRGRSRLASWVSGSISGPTN